MLSSTACRSTLERAGKIDIGLIIVILVGLVVSFGYEERFLPASIRQERSRVKKKFFVKIIHVKSDRFNYPENYAPDLFRFC